MKRFIVFFITLSYQLATIMASLRIMQGTSAAPGEYPYAVRLEFRDLVHPETKVFFPFFGYCSGALISSNWVLTAAHCHSQNKFPIQRIARFGPIPTEDMDNPEYFSNIESCFGYPGFKRDAMHWAIVPHDIALCKLEKSVIILKKYARLSTLDYKSLIGYEVVALGYGLNDATGVIASTLEAKMPLQKATYLLIECSAKKYGNDFFLVQNYPTICLAPKCGVSSTVSGGDSGGPIVHKSGIVAVTSAATNSFDGKNYRPEAGVITVVSPYIDWIVQVVQNN